MNTLVLRLQAWLSARAYQRHLQRKDWLIPDPLPVRLRQATTFVLVCSWRGHHRPASFSGAEKTCERCGR